MQPMSSEASVYYKLLVPCNRLRAHCGQVGAIIRDHESRDEGKEKVQVKTRAKFIDKLVPSTGNFTPNTRIDRNKGFR